MTALDLIARKRDGEAHTEAEIRFLVEKYVTGEIPDYQMAAWLMAVRIRGLTAEETLALTLAMVESGEMLDLSSAGPAVADKHSTGGVGDTVTLVLAPLVAACGLPFAKMSGRGLGHTGGTLDKLDSIPGFRTALSPAEFVTQLEDVGLVVAGQTERMVPADRLLYALRDATATIEQEGLIASSIMSKKIATGATAIVLDVKVGEGSFMKDLPAARSLASTMIDLGARAGRGVRAVLTDMDRPLGRAVGNALEVREAVGVLAGETGDLREVVLRLASRLLELSGLAPTPEQALAQARRNLDSGAALQKFRGWVEAQGGDPRVADGVGLPEAPLVLPVLASADGWLAGMHSLQVARAALLLGAGREVKGASIDPAVGVVLAAEPGSVVERGQALAWVHASKRGLAEQAVQLLAGALTVEDKPPASRTIILEEY